MSRKLLTSLFAVCACTAVAAQDQAQPAPRTQAPATTSQTTTTTSQTTTTAQGAAKAITIEGCVARSAPSSSTTGAIGTAGSTASGFILEKAAKPASATAADTASSNTIASTYRLDGDDSKLTPHVGHKVEVTGTVEAAMPGASGTAPAAAGAANAPKFKVDSVKMLAASCAP